MGKRNADGLFVPETPLPEDVIEGVDEEETVHAEGGDTEQEEQLLRTELARQREEREQQKDKDYEPTYDLTECSSSDENSEENLCTMEMRGELANLEGMTRKKFKHQEKKDQHLAQSRAKESSSLKRRRVVGNIDKAQNQQASEIALQDKLFIDKASNIYGKILHIPTDEDTGRQNEIGNTYHEPAFIAPDDDDQMMVARKIVEQAGNNYDGCYQSHLTNRQRLYLVANKYVTSQDIKVKKNVPTKEQDAVSQEDLSEQIGEMDTAMNLLLKTGEATRDLHTLKTRSKEWPEEQQLTYANLYNQATSDLNPPNVTGNSQVDAGRLLTYIQKTAKMTQANFKLNRLRDHAKSQAENALRQKQTSVIKSIALSVKDYLVSTKEWTDTVASLLPCSTFADAKAVFGMETQPGMSPPDVRLRELINIVLSRVGATLTVPHDNNPGEEKKN